MVLIRVLPFAVVASLAEILPTANGRSSNWGAARIARRGFYRRGGSDNAAAVDLHTKSGPVLYTNMLGWPPMLGFAAMGGEYGRLYEHMMRNAHAEDQDEPLLPPVGLALLLLGCAVGTGIGYTGWWCRSKISAASYTLIGVMNKCMTVLVNLLIWDKHAPVEGLVSLSLCLLGGVLYRQAPLRPVKEDEEMGGEVMVPLVKKSSDGIT